MANTIGEKELKTNYPVVEGITASNKLIGRRPFLKVQEESLLTERQKKGIK